MTDRAVFSRPEWQTFARAITAAPADDLPRLVAADWLRDRGTGETIADEATEPPTWTDVLPAHYYGDDGLGSGRGSGRGRGRGSDRGNEVTLMEPGKCYLILTVDWYAWAGRCLRQVAPYEYAFERVSKFDTNAGDVFGEIAAGDEALRRQATYQHFWGEQLLGLGRVAVAEWAGELPQEFLGIPREYADYAAQQSRPSRRRS